MFWTLLRQILVSGRARLGLAILSLAAGAAVTFSLLNLQSDAESKLTQEFRRLGANLVISPARVPGGGDLEPPLLDEQVAGAIQRAAIPGLVTAAPFLYVVARTGSGQSVIVAGTWPAELRAMSSWWTVEGGWISGRDDRERCVVGRKAARQLRIGPGDEVVLRTGGRERRLRVAGVADAGGSEESQIFVSLAVAQELADRPGRIGLVQASVRGTGEAIEAAAADLAGRLPGLEVRPVRQIAEAEGRILSRIRFLILSMVILILGLTVLSVLATMASVAFERRRDVGLMMALGGSPSKVVRLFLIEVTLLGASGGLLGSLAGSFLSDWVGRGIFSAPIASRPEVLLLTVALMVTVALAGALPLRLLGRIRPAAILRGE